MCLIAVHLSLVMQLVLITFGLFLFLCVACVFLRVSFDAAVLDWIRSFPVFVRRMCFFVCLFSILVCL